MQMPTIETANERLHSIGLALDLYNVYREKAAMTHEDARAKTLAEIKEIQDKVHHEVLAI
jgi:hypothetical protein